MRLPVPGSGGGSQSWRDFCTRGEPRPGMVVVRSCRISPWRRRRSFVRRKSLLPSSVPPPTSSQKCGETFCGPPPNSCAQTPRCKCALPAGRAGTTSSRTTPKSRSPPRAVCASCARMAKSQEISRALSTTALAPRMLHCAVVARPCLDGVRAVAERSATSRANAKASRRGGARYGSAGAAFALKGSAEHRRSAGRASHDAAISGAPHRPSDAAS
ncbi:hypothetical protein M885DRAFT_506036 [Pelagophyceae sp. CCMP2097]|nr:hypothetical protein M885DRAFT_506036 [Pelagophyceae sp. CCMP2097]